MPPRESGFPLGHLIKRHSLEHQWGTPEKKNRLLYEKTVGIYIIEIKMILLKCLLIDAIIHPLCMNIKLYMHWKIEG